MTRKEAERFVLESFGGLVEPSSIKGPANTSSYLFIYNKLDNGNKEVIHISGAINNIINELSDYK